MIDIGRSDVPGSGVSYSNQGGPAPPLIFEHQDNFAPPPYSSQPTGFCSQCRAPLQDLTAKFCPTCGYPVNQY
jgi:hypothetical protein